MIIESWHIATYLSIAALYCAARMAVKYTITNKYMFGMSDTEVVGIWLFHIVIAPLLVILDLFTILFKLLKNVPKVFEFIFESLD